jgi:hypothetical protein
MEKEEFIRRICSVHGDDYSGRLKFKLCSLQNSTPFDDFIAELNRSISRNIINRGQIFDSNELMKLAIQCNLKFNVGIRVIEEYAMDTPRYLSFFQVQYKLKHGIFPITDDELWEFMDESRCINIKSYKSFRITQGDVKMKSSDNRFFNGTLFSEPESLDQNLHCFINDHYAVLQHSNVLIGGDFYDAFSMPQIQAIFSEPHKFYVYWKEQYFFGAINNFRSTWILNLGQAYRQLFYNIAAIATTYSKVQKKIYYPYIVFLKYYSY